MAAIVKAKAFIPSKREFEFLREKFPAFTPAIVSEKAKNQGAYVSSKYGIGCFPLRTTWFQYFYGSSGPRCTSEFHAYFGYDVNVYVWDYWQNSPSGLRVALCLTYNSESDLVRGLREVTRSTKVWDGRNEKELNLTSTAPVVVYGGNEYIWTNKEDCQSGKSQIMSVVSLDLIERALPFANGPGQNENKYAGAEELRAQCERVAFENATTEEKAMAVEVEMISGDNYESLTVVREKVSEEEIEKEQ